MLRHLYSLLFSLALPCILLRLRWRARQAPDYAKRWQERLGFYTFAAQPCDIWIHAVSVGEAEAVFALVTLLQQRQRDIKIVVTSTTPTGSARILAVLKTSVQHVYLPYDVPFAVQRFLKHFQPKVAAMVETELWLNICHYCSRYNVTLFIINARLSEKSQRGYCKIPHLIKPALASVHTILTQSSIDTQRFIAIGANSHKIHSVGNIKFDGRIDPQLISQGKHIKATQFQRRFVLLCASTHDNEELQLINLYAALKQQIPSLLMIIAPRHPERFAVVRQLITQQGLTVLSRSDNKTCTAAIEVYLLDSMGELKLFYASADICFVGGSLVDIGGHNIIEPAAIGTPILFGQYMRHFKTIAEQIISAKAAMQCQGSEQLKNSIMALYQKPLLREQLISNAKAFVQAHQGATAYIAEQLINALH